MCGVIKIRLKRRDATSSITETDNLQGRGTPLAAVVVYISSNHAMMCMIFFIKRPTYNQLFEKVLTVQGDI